MRQRRKILAVSNITNTALYNEARTAFMNAIREGQDLKKIEEKYLEENPNLSDQITITRARRDAEWAVVFAG